MGIALIIFLVILSFYTIIQVYRTMCRMGERRGRPVIGAKYLANMCPRCFSIMFTWMAGIFFLPDLILTYLIGMSVTEFAFLLHEKSRQPLLLFFMMEFSFVFALFRLFRVLNIYTITATFMGAFILAFSLLFHRLMKLTKHPLTEKVPTALIVAVFLSILIISETFKY